MLNPPIPDDCFQPTKLCSRCGEHPADIPHVDFIFTRILALLEGSTCAEAEVILKQALAEIKEFAIVESPRSPHNATTPDKQPE